MQKISKIVAILITCCVINCANNSSNENSQSNSPSDSFSVYPPPAIAGQTVDAYGTPLDSEIARCVQTLKTTNSTIENVFGTKSNIDDRSGQFGGCWCKSKGYSGIDRDGSCAR